MVQAIGSRADDGRVTIVAWNGTVDVTKAAGAPILDRSVSLTSPASTASRYRLRHRRLDATHSNLVARWTELGGTRRLAGRRSVGGAGGQRIASRSSSRSG